MDSVLSILSSVILFVYNIIATVVVWIWDLIVGFFSFLADIPITQYSWLNAIIAFVILMVLIGIINSVISSIKAKARAAEEEKARELRRIKEEELEKEYRIARRKRWEEENTCPECQAIGEFVLDRTEEIDRYDTNKEVEEKLANGKTKTRHIKCTKVVEREHYHCDECGYKFTVTLEARELD
ncbi:hypothetical protein [Lonepinella sp. BR2357]|uniref:hypothetical protein n=1 Tax=Lonepinella sp. BR2357 TaxID=3434549 RepID=UPI003F6DC99A